MRIYGNTRIVNSGYLVEFDFLVMFSLSYYFHVVSGYEYGDFISYNASLETSRILWINIKNKALHLNDSAIILMQLKLIKHV